MSLTIISRRTEKSIYLPPFLLLFYSLSRYLYFSLCCIQSVDGPLENSTHTHTHAHAHAHAKGSMSTVDNMKKWWKWQWIRYNSDGNSVMSNCIGECWIRGHCDENKKSLICFDCAQWFSRIILFNLSMGFFSNEWPESCFYIYIYIQIPATVLIKLVLFSRRNSCLMQQPVDRNHITHYENGHEKGPVSRTQKKMNERRSMREKKKRKEEANHNHRSSSRKSFIIFPLVNWSSHMCSRRFFFVVVDCVGRELLWKIKLFHPHKMCISEWPIFFSFLHASVCSNSQRIFFYRCWMKI